MAKKKLYGCKVCKALSEETRCPYCDGEVSKEWSGYLIILNHDRSRIAEKMDINYNGKFTLKVR